MHCGFSVNRVTNEKKKVHPLSSVQTQTEGDIGYCWYVLCLSRHPAYFYDDASGVLGENELVM